MSSMGDCIFQRWKVPPKKGGGRIADRKKIRDIRRNENINKRGEQNRDVPANEFVRWCKADSCRGVVLSNGLRGFFFVGL